MPLQTSPGAQRRTVSLAPLYALPQKPALLLPTLSQQSMPQRIPGDACGIPDMATSQGCKAGDDRSDQWTHVGQHVHLDFVCLHGLSKCAWRGLQLGCSAPPGSGGPHAPKRAPRQPSNSWPVLAGHGPMTAIRACLRPDPVKLCWCVVAKPWSLALGRCSGLRHVAAPPQGGRIKDCSHAHQFWQAAHH